MRGLELAGSVRIHDGVPRRVAALSSVGHASRVTPILLGALVDAALDVGPLGLGGTIVGFIQLRWKGWSGEGIEQAHNDVPPCWHPTRNSPCCRKWWCNSQGLSLSPEVCWPTTA